MNTAGAVRMQGYRIAFPGYLPFNPGNDIPAGGPQQLSQFYQDQTLAEGRARRPLRRRLRAHQRRPHVLGVLERR